MIEKLFIFLWFLLHPVHVTLTSIDFVPDPGGFNVFVRMYFDDFLTDSKINRTEIKDRDFSAGTSASKQAMEKYLNEKLIISVNEKQLSGKLQEMNLSENEISTSLEYRDGRKPKKIIVRNFIMTSLYSDMSNMVIVKVKEFEEGVKLTSDVTEQTFEIK